MTSTELVVSPNHYTNHWWFEQECLDIIRGWDFLRGSAFKYVFRMWDTADPDVDLDRAIYCLEDILIYGSHWINRFDWWLQKHMITEKRFAKIIKDEDLDPIQEIELKGLLRLYWGDIPGAHQAFLDLREALTSEEG